MIWHRTLGLILSAGGLGWAGLASAQPAPSTSTRLTSLQDQSRAILPTGGVEIALLRSLQANPATSIYAFQVERRGSKYSLRGRVGTKLAHDAAIQTALALNVPVIDDLVIDTLAAHQAATYADQLAAYRSGQGGSGGPGMAGYGQGYGSAGPSSGLGGFPGATSLYTGLPYTYPPPIFGKYDEPFFGFEPPVFSYPTYWGALSAARVGPPNQAQPNAPQQQGMGQTANNAPVDPAVQAMNLPDGTIDMEIDGRGVATLRGNVPSLAERITLGQKVAQTPGVTSVVNLLNVKPGMAVATVATVAGDKPPPPPIPADANQNPNPVPVLVAKPATDNPAIAVDANDPVGQRATRALANRSGLANPAAVKVKVRDGMATLTGKVPTVYEAMLAYRAVQRTPGVREIDDRLEFVVPDGTGINPLADKGRPEDVEPYLEAQLRRQLGDLAHLDRVRVHGDNLEIHGTIEREDDRTRFDAILRSMPILRGFRVTAEIAAESR
jgi:osmotically-inducible protein OsmY